MAWEFSGDEMKWVEDTNPKLADFLQNGGLNFADPGLQKALRQFQHLGHEADPFSDPAAMAWALRSLGVQPDQVTSVLQGSTGLDPNYLNSVHSSYGALDKRLQEASQEGRGGALAGISKAVGSVMDPAAEIFDQYGVPITAAALFAGAGALGGAGAGTTAAEGAGALDIFGSTAGNPGWIDSAFTGGAATGATGGNMDVLDIFGSTPDSPGWFEGDWGGGALPGGDEALDIFGSTPGEPGWFPGEWPDGGGAGLGLLDTIKQYGSSAVSAAQRLFSGDGSALNDLLKLGVPAALIAGLFEKNESPLMGPMTDAARKAFESAGEFGALPTPGLTPSQRRAIQLANDNTGEWRPYIDKAAKGIPGTDLNEYMNPFIKGALDPAAQEINRLAEKKRLANQAKAAQVGAFGGSRAAVEKGALDRSEMEAVGDLYKTGYAGAFDRATGLATTDLNRNLALGGTVGALGDRDYTRLTAAGALERQPYEDERARLADKTKLYTGVVHGTAPALDRTTPDSMLTKATGALGAYSSLKDLGIA